MVINLRYCCSVIMGLREGPSVTAHADQRTPKYRHHACWFLTVASDTAVSGFACRRSEVYVSPGGRPPGGLRYRAPVALRRLHPRPGLLAGRRGCASLRVLGRPRLASECRVSSGANVPRAGRLVEGASLTPNPFRLPSSRAESSPFQQ